MKLVYFVGALSLVSAISFAVAGCQGDDTAGGPSFGFDGGFSLPDGGTPPGVAPVDTTLTKTPAQATKDKDAHFEFTSTRPATFVCRVDGQAPAACTTPFTVTVAEGPHTFEVSAVTSDGAIDTTPAKFDWTVDLTPPKTTITKAPPALDSSTDVSIEFSASEPATFQCVIDSAAPVACTSPFKATGLTDGSHTFTVAGTDAAGNVETPPASKTWTLDTSLPDTTIDSGPSGTVGTQANNFTFSSPSTAASITFECSVDNAAFAACASPFTVTTTDGAHSFRVRAKDGNGNVDPTPAERLWTIDSSGPTVTITGGPNGPTNNATPTFTFVSTGATTTECRIDAAAFAACTSPFTTATLAQGGHTFEVRVKNGAGTTASATRNFSVATTLPSVTITSGPAGPTNNKTPTFTFTADAGTTVTCSVDGGTFVACNATFTTAALVDGPHTFDVHATDAANNVGTASRSFTVDTTSPTVTIVSGPNGATNVNAGTFTFNVSETATAQCKINLAPFAACSTPTSYLYGPLVDGFYTFTVLVTDSAGNTGTTSQNFTVDTVPPTVAITSGPTGPTNNKTPSFNFTMGNGGISAKCRVDAGAYNACTSPFTTPVLAQGAHTVYVQSFDAAGNPSTAATRSFTVDTTPPAVSVTQGPTTVYAGATVQFTFTKEAGSTSQCRIYTQGAPSGAYTACPNSPATMTAPSTSGNWTFEIQATDAAGNSATATWNFGTYIIG